MKGGLRIEPSGSERWCTSGFIGRVSGSDPPDYRVISAGHCAEQLGGIDTMWQHHEENIGRATLETWYSGTDADVGLIRVADEGGPYSRIFACGPSPRAINHGRSLSCVQAER